MQCIISNYLEKRACAVLAVFLFKFQQVIDVTHSSTWVENYKMRLNIQLINLKDNHAMYHLKLPWKQSLCTVLAVFLLKLQQVIDITHSSTSVENYKINPCPVSFIFQSMHSTVWTKFSIKCIENKH